MGGTTGDHDVAPLNFFQQLKDLVGHHAAQSGGYFFPGHAFIGGVSAIGFTKDGAAARHLMRILSGRPGGGLVQGDIHAAQLLEEKLAGTGSAFIARLDAGDPAFPVEEINHEGFATGRYNCRTGGIHRLDVGIRQFHGVRFRYRGQVKGLPKPTTSGRNPRQSGHVQRFQGLKEGLFGIAVVGIEGMRDNTGPIRRGQVGGD